MNRLLFALVIASMLGTSGCFLTKAVTVPMRVTGAAISIVPVVGNTVDGTIDKAADVVDKIPL